MTRADGLCVGGPLLARGWSRHNGLAVGEVMVADWKHKEAEVRALRVSFVYNLVIFRGRIESDGPRYNRNLRGKGCGGGPKCMSTDVKPRKTDYDKGDYRLLYLVMW